MSFDRIVHAFAGNPLDRIAAERPDPDRIAALLAAPESRFAAFAGERPLIAVAADGSRMDICWLTGDDARRHGIAGVTPTLLGLMEDGTARFAFQLAVDDEGRAPAEIAARGKFIDLRSLATQGLIGQGELGMLAQARSIAAWHARHGFCANCGAPTAPGDGGYKRVCAACNAEHFPRTDPVAIMVVHHDGHLLLGRQSRFVEGVYSCLAGFIEPGESIEEAARREIFEESGVRVGPIQYHSSQPWPFPSNLMIGLIGEALGRELQVDYEELEDARWFPLDEVRRMQERTHPEGLCTPPDISIAHQLIRWFLAQG